MERTIKNKLSIRVIVWLAVAVLAGGVAAYSSQGATRSGSPEWLGPMELLNHNATTTISAFSHNGSAFTGTLTGSRNDCFQMRSVNIYLVLAGSTIGPTPVATATTDNDGNFTSTPFVAAPGSTYRAVVSPNTHCLGATSDYTVPAP